MSTDVPGGAIFDLLARLADNKYLLGRRYAEWCSSAPTLESSVAAAAMAQDELGHARALYPLLRTLRPDAGPEIDPETRTAFLNLPALDQPFTSWMDFLAANFLIDQAMTILFESAQSSSYESLAGRSRKVLQEERLHTLHADGWVRRLAREGGRVRAALEAALRADWAQTLCWLGPAGADDPLSVASVLDSAPDALRARLLAVVGPVVAETRLALPVRRIRGGVWAMTEELPWDAWSATTYRLKLAAPVAPSAAE